MSDKDQESVGSLLWDVETISILLIGAGLLSGLGLFGWQVLSWLRTSMWPPVSVITGLEWLELRWAIAPRSWFGLHKLLDGISLAVVLPFLGVGAAAAVGSVVKEVQEARTKKP